MHSDFYLPRKLLIEGKVHTEEALLKASRHLVILAEPGAGKTQLMESLAQKLDVSCVTANVFHELGADKENQPLVIDAFDELAKIGQRAIHMLLGNARKAKPSHVIVSSRSSEWDNASTIAFEEFLGVRPLVARLCEFNEAEQEEIFRGHAPEEDYQTFRAEVSRFDLAGLLPNPQFLKLFADAYIESDRSFIDKRHIFAQAVERLAKEANPRVENKEGITSSDRKELASEVFAVLLLSGSEGVGVCEATEDNLYPLLGTLLPKSPSARCILRTRLFRPSDSEDRHRPVHKIVAEYCAASYLTTKIAAPNDPLTLPRCLSIIAPNATVRDELRGLVGWMAALGNKDIQETLIELDPYSVIANGDPSQIANSSKQLLIHRLKKAEEEDPYFRRGDLFRTFSAKDFFTEDIIMNEVKAILVSGGGGHLTALILELLEGSKVVQCIKKELRHLMLTPGRAFSARWLASSRLLEIDGYDVYEDISGLIKESTRDSLKISSLMIERKGIANAGIGLLENFFRACTVLYPNRIAERIVGSRFFIGQFISSLDLDTTEALLDALSTDLVCACRKAPYECECREGISKIIGSLLDHYFCLARPPFEPAQVFRWIRNLNFHELKGTKDSASVRVLQEDHSLRREIFRIILGDLNDHEEISKVMSHELGWHSHSGLTFEEDDQKFLVDLAFRSENVALWAYFIEPHRYHANKSDRGPNALRRDMRAHALTKPSLMREWAKANRAAAARYSQERRWSIGRARKIERRRARAFEDARLKYKAYVAANRELIEQGRDWKCLVRFTEYVLLGADQIELGFDDTLVRQALTNCLDFIDKYIPGLGELASLQCASKSLQSEEILFAACLEIMRSQGGLESINVRLLKALRTNLNTRGSVCEDELEAMRSEVNRLVFSDNESIESFLREYLEPQIFCAECQTPELHLLREPIFAKFRAELPVEWIERCRDIALPILDRVFEIAAEFGNQGKLKRIVAQRSAELISNSTDVSASDEEQDRRSFWFFRAWYFLDEPPEEVWEFLQSERDTVLALNGRSGRLYGEECAYWPKLSSRKVERILSSFIQQWPKVELPSSWGTESPKEETAYRFLKEVIWHLNTEDPDEALPVLTRLLADERFLDMYGELKSIHAAQRRAKALQHFKPPQPEDIVDWLAYESVINVEGLRQLVIDELGCFQSAINGGEFNSGKVFYEKGERRGEESCSEIVSERLNLRLESRGITITPEHRLKDAKRSDFTIAKHIAGRRCLLVVEVKGQWHRDLYTAAAAQLYERYSIHPDAEQQGVFLVIWFGAAEEVAGKKNHGIRSAQELKSDLQAALPSELRGRIDVFVLDVSRQ